MSLMKRSFPVLLSLSFLAAAGLGAIHPAPARADDSVVGDRDLQQAVDGKVASQDADRAALRELLNRQDVRSAAEGAGLDVNRALDAVNTLSGDELSTLGQQAQTLNEQLAGGDRVVITTTVLTLVLVLVLILLLA